VNKKRTRIVEELLQKKEKTKKKKRDGTFKHPTKKCGKTRGQSKGKQRGAKQKTPKGIE